MSVCVSKCAGVYQALELRNQALGGAALVAATALGANEAATGAGAEPAGSREQLTGGKMNICIVGGIFDKDAAYRQAVSTTPETLLASGLRQRGHAVAERGHWSVADLDGFDIVHVHHLGPGAVRAAVDPGSAKFVYTNHASGHPSWTRSLALKFVLGRADALVALSAREAAWQRAQARVSGRQHVIPNGVDEEVFRFEPPQWPHDPPWRLLYVGQLVPLKGLDYLLQAMALLGGKHRLRLDLAFHIDHEEARLRRLCAQLHLTEVNFLGARAPRELVKLYRDCDMLVLPSTSEALPSVISEALSVGRPVVATDVGGVREQVQGFGVVVAPRDAGALAQGIESVIENYGEFARKAEQESRRVARTLSLRAMIDAHEALYGRLLSGVVRRRRWRHRPASCLVSRALRLPVVRPRPTSHS